MALLEKLRQEDETKQKKLYRFAANLVVKEILPHYQKSQITTIQEHKMAEKILALFKEYENLRKINLDRRENHPLIKMFKDKLGTTMKFWPRNALAKMEQSKVKKRLFEIAAIDEDISFLNSMMTNRAAQYSSVDIKMSKIDNRRLVRKQEGQRMKENQKKRQQLDATLAQLSASSEDEHTDEEDATVPIYSLSTPKRSHERVVKIGTNIFVPHDILKSPQVVFTSTRNKITPTAMSATLTSIIAACGGNTDSVNLHWSTAYRYKVEASNSIALKINDNWKPPRVDLLHWDSKLMNTLDTSIKQEERLPTLLSGIVGTKLLSISSFPHKFSEKAGTLIANATVKLLENWNCINSPCGMVFDTTSANTGHKTAGCAAVQESLKRELLWFACRHHIGEVLLKHV